MKANRKTLGRTLLLALAGFAVPWMARPAEPEGAFVIHSGLPRAAIVSIKSEIVVALRDAGNGPETARRVRLQGEAASEEAAQRLGYRSMRSVAEIDCDTRRDRVLEMETFIEHGLKGEGSSRPVPGGWVQPSMDAFMADVIRAVCKGGASARLATFVPEPTPKTSFAPTPSPTLYAPVLRASLAADAPRLREPPAGRLMMLGPITRLSSGAPRRSVASGARAQIGAFLGVGEARSALGGFVLPSGVQTSIETAQVGGRTFHRALVVGFSGSNAARSFCESRRALGKACVVR